MTGGETGDRGKPVIFSGPMVRALLAGRKTQTRRLIKPQPTRPEEWAGTWVDAEKERSSGHMDGERAIVPHQRGDRLWVRENWWSDFAEGGLEHGYLADGEPYAGNASVKRGSSMMMPRRLSRLTLTVTDVRVQRLQDISEEDALAEGIERLRYPEIGDWGWPQLRYRDLWNSLHGADAWEQNPWIAAYTFTVQHGNIDALASTSEPS